MARRLPRLALALAAAATLLASAEARAQRRMSAGDVAVAADLLRLEDRREFDAATISAAAANANTEIRRHAVLAAGRIGDKSATPLVVARLADGDSAVAASAAFALGLLRDTSAVSALMALLNDAEMARRPSVTGEAALALAKLGTPAGKLAVTNFLVSAPMRGPGAQRAVGEALLASWRFPGPLPITGISRWLDSPDPELRWRAAYALTRRPSAAGARLLAARTGDANALVRSFAMRGLSAALADSAGIDTARAIERVIAGTRDADHAVSVNAVRSLGSYARPEAIARLNELLTGADEYLAVTAAESLGRLGRRAPQGAGPLRIVALTTSKPIFLRTTALAALAEVDRASAVAAADEMWTEPEWRPRAAAARVYALSAARPGYATDPQRAKLEAAARDPNGVIASAALEAAVAAVADSAARIRPLLLEGLRSPDLYARSNASGGLAVIADPADAPLLFDAYERAQRDSADDAALAAVDALGQIARKDRSVAHAFFARFPRSGDYLVRQHAAAAFGDSVARPAWGAPLPIATGRGLEFYRALVRRGEAAPRPRVRLVTERGTIELELFAADAPLTVDNFLALARRKYFDGQAWPRVVPNFVIQGGDPRGDTNGGPGYAIRDEIDRHPYLAGTLGMALSGPDTGGSQWFVTHSPQPHLDGTYTVFGRVVRGMEVAGRVLPGERILRVEEVR